MHTPTPAQLQNTFPVRMDITIRQGSLFQMLPLWMVRDGEGNMLPMDLTGYIAKMQIRTNPGTAVVAEYSTDNARILLPSEDEPTWEDTDIHVFQDTTKTWNVWVRIPATDTVNLPDGIYQYDLELEPPGNPSGRFAFYAGKCRIEAEVTK